MERLMDDLNKLILNQIEFYEKLLEVLHKENEIILSSSVEDLASNNKKKEVVVLQIKLLDESCRQLVEKIYQAKSIEHLESSLPHLMEVLDNSGENQLRPVYTKLVQIAQKVKETNGYNESLIKGSLRAIKSSISFLVSCASSGTPTYENSGQLRSDQMVRSLLSEEA